MNGTDSTGKTYEDFIGKYLSKYDKHNLFVDLRCLLVHNYSVGEKLALSRENCGLHLQKTTDGKTILAIQEFAADLEVGFNDFINDLSADIKTRISATAWLKYHKIIVMGKVEAAVTP
jgi:hypothetical protein